MPVPFMELSLRERPAGGGIRAKIKATGRSVRHVRYVTLFIHGFNVNHADAHGAYTKFCGFIPPEKKRDHLWWAYWPGDASSSKVISALRYPDTPDRAVMCARMLAGHLARIARYSATGKIYLRIVAHSMGCRLALELVDRIANTSEIELRLLALMAAAVPQYKVGEHELLDLDAIRVQTRVVVFHSGDDWVLRFLFRPGQLIERPSLGRFGAGRGAIGRLSFTLSEAQVKRNRVWIYEMKGYGHSNYWSSEEIALAVARRFPSLAGIVAP